MRSKTLLKPVYFFAIASLFLVFHACLPGQEKTTYSLRNPEDFELEGISIEELQRKMKQGQYTSRQITQMYLDHIRDIDQEGPELHAVIALNPDALTIADSMDRERMANRVRGPLHGIPILIKDNINTGDKMPTTAGSLALANHRAQHDAFIIRQLRNAGAVILGKTNLSEWSNFRSHQSISGWSSVGGQTKNPYVLSQNPCGSSTGSAVAVAADLCVVSVGTATDGSIACPASMNGVVGMKPTVGLVSRSGVIPISKTQDTPGPIARTVRDAAILLGAMTGEDPGDPKTLDSRGKTKKDYTRFLNPEALRGKRIGVEKAMLGDREGIGALFHKALDAMRSKGAVIVEVEFQDHYYALAQAESEVLKYEFKDGINAYLSSANSPMKTLEDIIAFNTQNESLVMQYFKQDLMESAQEKGGLDHPEYQQALASLFTMKPYLIQLMEVNNLDALCGVGSGAYGPAAIAGFPSITVPMGTVKELPVGLTFFGRPYDESGLLAIAYAYEQIMAKRHSPKYIEHL